MTHRGEIRSGGMASVKSWLALDSLTQRSPVLPLRKNVNTGTLSSDNLTKSGTLTKNTVTLSTKSVSFFQFPDV